MKYIDPLKIPKEDLPLIVLSDHSSGFIQWAIKARTKGNYNHVMTCIKTGTFDSQGNTFSRIPMSRYMTPHSRLKFWKIKDLTEKEKASIRLRIMRRLNLPSWKRRYDYIGLIGQVVGLRWINNPWTPYCSEQVRDDVLEGLISTPKHPTPTDLNRIFKDHPWCEIYGRWASD